MAFVGRNCTAKEVRLGNKYRAAYKRWVIALYNKEILGKNPFAFVTLTEIIPEDAMSLSHNPYGGGMWGKSFTVTGKEYEEKYKNLPEDSRSRYSLSGWVTEYDMADLFLRGWKRKSGGVM